MLKRVVASFAAAVVGAIVGMSSASAEPPVECHRDPITGQCVIVVTNPGQPPTPGGGGTGGGGNGGGGTTECTFAGEVIPCKVDEGYWSDDRACYVAVDSAPPPASDPVWEGHHPEGAIYSCWLPGSTAMSWFWSLTPPAGAVAPPDPRVLAQQAIAAMNLRAVTIGIVPESTPGSIGVVGMPTWMWVEGPTPATMGPITRSASARGFSVTATAKVQRVVWKMGDGKSVTCTGPGTPYADNYGKKSSPSCGHTYTRQGRYAVTATSYWTVTWSGIGQSGTIPLDFASTTNLTMGESQVVTQ